MYNVLSHSAAMLANTLCWWGDYCINILPKIYV